MRELFALNNPLTLAAYDGDLETVDRLIAAGDDIHINHDAPFRLAAEFGRQDVLESLLQAGADVDASNGFALLRAAHQGHTQVVRRLLDAGANPLRHNKSALRWAIERGHYDIKQMLETAIHNLEQRQSDTPVVRYSYNEDSWFNTIDEALEPIAGEVEPGEVIMVLQAETRNKTHREALGRLPLSLVERLAENIHEASDLWEGDTYLNDLLDTSCRLTDLSHQLAETLTQFVEHHCAPPKSLEIVNILPNIPVIFDENDDWHYCEPDNRESEHEVHPTVC